MQKRWIVAGSIGAAAAAWLSIRLLRGFVASDEESETQNDAMSVKLYRNERLYPPFRDADMSCASIDGDKAQQQLFAIVVFEHASLETLQRLPGSAFALARRDAIDVWRPLVAKEWPLFGEVITSAGAQAACALPVAPGMQCVALGAMLDSSFKALSAIKITAIATKEGVLYDYPGVPVLYIQEQS